MRFLSIFLLVFASVTAYGSSTGTLQDTQQISIYKYLGSRQCEGGGRSLSELKRQLVDAGIKVLGSSYGADGRMYPAVCGAADGRIGIFEIAATDAEAALALGFAPLNNLPEANRTECQ